MVGVNAGQAAAEAGVRQQLAQGFALLQGGQLAQASELSAALVAAHPLNAEVLFLASETRLAMDDPEGALGFISAAVDAAPGQLVLLLKKADNLTMLRQRDAARGVAEAAAALAGTDPMALWEVGRLYARIGDPVAARTLFEQALPNAGRYPRLLFDLASAQLHTGDLAAAEDNLDKLLAIFPADGNALHLRSTLRRQTPASNHVDDLGSRLQGRFANPALEAACRFALAKELEDLGQFDRSFGVLTEAATLKRKTLEYDAAAERQSIEAISATYTAEVMQQPVPGHREEGAIFIVGMPRTGTTLLERMLTRHPDVKSAGELLDFGQILSGEAMQQRGGNVEKSLIDASVTADFEEIGRSYMRSAREAAGGSRFFIDKMPINYMYCGMIRRALPDARIIHMVRDPMDCCYAVYKTLFNQAYYFSYDLRELAAYYISYHRMMQHWHAVMPGAILDVRYEDLVNDTEPQVRGVLEWCGLDWRAEVLEPAGNTAPAMTASAAQVREPVYSSSVGKWRRYETGLQTLRDLLAEAGIVDPPGSNGPAVSTQR
jgi:tetratricopeptide (TPR) repeat protein